ncbi:hypothetical protein [Magnetospirillum sp. SS-4]|uniref:hypothetical protein n=1 Tax=Magnetospirillum sp. SS-4 TaxID=2681465 RepID=UPI00137DDD1B|nr:hypothetical protein [Magnetospirillum sp. SS-4]CAA7627524.1 conserved exported hypothetical protein [Magnetospirillum sp. SS-4]
MRSTWPFVAGVIVAALVTAFNLPIMAATALGMMYVRSLDGAAAMLQGESSVMLREDGGRLSIRMVNTGYSIASVPVVGEPRPRRLLVRQHVVLGEDGLGRASLDAWPMGSVAELRKAPLYSVRAIASGASLGDDGMFWTEHAGRRTAYSLTDGFRLFDADLPLVQFAFEPDSRRMAALALADEEYAERGGVAVITYAAPARVLRRLVLVADDPMRAATLRATMTSTRLVSYTDEAMGGRVIELPLAAGPVRVPVTVSDLETGRAVLPAGLRLVPLREWGTP